MVRGITEHAMDEHERWVYMTSQRLNKLGDFSLTFACNGREYKYLLRLLPSTNNKQMRYSVCRLVLANFYYVGGTTNKQRVCFFRGSGDDGGEERGRERGGEGGEEKDQDQRRQVRASGNCQIVKLSTGVGLRGTNVVEQREEQRVRER